MKIQNNRQQCQSVGQRSTFFIESGMSMLSFMAKLKYKIIGISAAARFESVDQSVRLLQLNVEWNVNVVIHSFWAEF
jgi:hypothetical protein